MQSARLVPGWTVTGSRRLRVLSRSSATDGDARSHGAFGEFAHGQSVVRDGSSRSRHGRDRPARLLASGGGSPPGHRGRPHPRLRLLLRVRRALRPARLRGGVGWHVLSAWRFGFGALLAWLWVAGVARTAPRACACSIDGAAVDRGCSRRPVHRQLGHVLRRARDVSGLARVADRLHLPGVVAVLALRFGRRLEGRRPWIALGLALVGVALAVGGIPEGAVPPLGGLALIVASPLIYSVWIVLSARGCRASAANRSGAMRTVARTPQRPRR